jgi:S-adenosylhomocysteine hydrolase
MSKLFDEYRIPHALHEVREKHFEIAAKFSSEFGIVRELIELRNAIKNAPIEKVLRAPKTSPRMEAMKRTLIEELEARKANIAAAHASANFSIQNEHVPHVSIHGHWVWGHKGTKFVRHFWYLNGRVTAENTIAAVFQKLEDEGKIEPFVDEDGQTRVRVAK